MTVSLRDILDSGDMHARARARTVKICSKLGVKEYGEVYSLKRPKGMHKKTFQRLREAVFEAAETEDAAYAQVLYAFAKRVERRNRKARKMLGWKDGSAGELI